MTTLAMGAIAVAPSNPQIIYAGTGKANNSGDSLYGRGVLKSNDGGATWTELQGNVGANEFNLATISKIVIDPTNADTVYVAVSNNYYGDLSGIWKSTDGGTTWVDTTTAPTGEGIPIQSDAFSDLVMDPTHPNTLYAAVGAPKGSGMNGVFVTTDGGDNWRPAGDFPGGPGDGRIALAMSPFTDADPSSLHTPATTSSSAVTRDTTTIRQRSRLCSPSGKPPDRGQVTSSGLPCSARESSCRGNWSDWCGVCPPLRERPYTTMGTATC